MDSQFSELHDKRVCYFFCLRMFCFIGRYRLILLPILFRLGSGSFSQITGLVLAKHSQEVVPPFLFFALFFVKLKFEVFKTGFDASSSLTLSRCFANFFVL